MPSFLLLLLLGSVGLGAVMLGAMVTAALALFGAIFLMNIFYH